ncbi:MAG: hypothetical protein PHU08_04485, partial [Dehalococcoidales bacterium]|nr:hypothetical protein [Dehalococcoidales bacterium]
MAINASGAPSNVIVGGPQNGRTFADVAQDMVDWSAFAQNEGVGGWTYEANESYGDNSVSGYVALGLAYAEAAPPWGFALNVPAFVYSELDNWVDFIQNDANGDGDDGGSGYTDPSSWVNLLKTGNLLAQMSMVGDTNATPRVQDAIDYIERHWNDNSVDPGWRDASGPHKQACFTMMKGFQALGIESITVGGNPVDWYDVMSTALVNNQNANGSWPSDYWADTQMSTCWALLTLEKAAPPALALLPPFATNATGTQHTVTARYEIAGVPQVGVTINFEVIAGPNAGESGTDVTDSNGEATFTYTGSGGVGTDTIRATAVDQSGNPLISTQATKVWEEGPGPGPQVPSISGWGIAIAAILLLALTPLALRRRKSSAASR